MSNERVMQETRLDFMELWLVLPRERRRRGSVRRGGGFSRDMTRRSRSCVTWCAATGRRDWSELSLRRERVCRSA